ncbi:LacI family transcriptional regulator [Acuticoccus sediminis]|uniref:LacI family transcriptional regulator n=1 Tax=Acuticoccus sediminis TaxID=2184697 RepID=A0A8B2NQM1_9HYPH|nr:LacI family DNA-binding transcriptional regulator [Acuticoccus sediminis]RAH99303.1 LacI family transcriptional regulator [Acuticoccus sediminis]
MNKKTLTGPATLRDVAAAAGVDVSTVSRVLQNKGRVGAETRARILSTAERLGYQGNPVARALKTARSSTILMVVPQIENPIFASAIISAEIEARRCGYALLVAYDQGGTGGKIIEDISRSSMIEGVIIASYDDDERMRQTLASTDRPHVIINRVLPGDANCVAMDTRSAARIGTRHLIDLGHRRIGHLAGRLGRFNGESRRRGWAEAMEEAGLEASDDLVAEAGYDPDRVPAGVDALLGAGVTAIHAATLLTGAAAIARLHSRGLRVPDDVSVVTMHDDLLARVVYPDVTTVALPTEEMGRVAVQRIVGLIEGGATGEGVVLLPPGDLVVRSSAAPPSS